MVRFHSPQVLTQKGLSPIVIVLLISAVIIGLLAYSGKINLGQLQVKPASEQAASVSDETADWKTYTNNKYEYSINYPTDWPVSDITPQIVTLNQGNEKYPKNNAPWIRITADFVTGTECGDFICGNDEVNILQDPVSIAGKTWNKWTSSNSDESMYYLKSPSILIVTRDLGQPQLINQILGSFKFLNQNITNSEEYIEFNGRKLLIKRVGEGEYCEGRVGSTQTFIPKCSEGLKCQFREGTSQDAPGNCVKE